MWYWDSWRQFSNTSWSHCFADPAADGGDLNGLMPIGQDGNAAIAVQIASNHDIGWTLGNAFNAAMRFRHGLDRGAKMNVLFCDGHVEAFTIGTLPKSLFCVTPQR